MESIEPANPYAPPKADINVASPADVLTIDLASRWQRLGGALVDGIVAWAGLGPAYLGISFAEVAKQSGSIKNPFFVYMASGSWGRLAAVLTILVTGLQWFLIVKRGQTIGKIVAGTRIVMVDGSRAGFLNALALRTWTVWAAGQLAAAVSAVSFLFVIDILLIFRRDRRCLHDLIAGTKVARIKPKAVAGT